MHRRTFIKHTGAVGIWMMISPKGAAETFGETDIFDLEAIFKNPPQQTYPQTFWFWMNGHVSKEGITLDLEAMKRIGIGGVFQFDGGIGIPKGPVSYGSSEWLSLKKHAIEEAGRLGLSFTMHNCPGWSSSGGPWVTPELAMQQVTWSESYIKGGRKVQYSLPQPFTKLEYYRDTVVIAFPSLEGEATLQNFKVSTNHGEEDSKKLSGQDRKGLLLQLDRNGVAWVQVELEAPLSATSITFLIRAVENKGEVLKEAVFAGQRGAVQLEGSNDGVHFDLIATINTGLEAELIQGDKFITFDFARTNAKFFRLRSDRPRWINQMRLSGITRLENFMEKTGRRFMYSGEGISPVVYLNNQEVSAGSIIDSKFTVDLSKHIDGEGLLTWSAPPGNWTILRIGYTPLGTLNKAAPDGGIGLECDKFSAAAMDHHFTHMLEELLTEMKALVEKGGIGLEIDSYEAGPQNWTPSLVQTFIKTRGYDPIPYLPALTGRIVGSVDQTERFLWDFRRTLADLMADHYYGRFTELCHQHGFTSVIEPYDKGPMEELQIGSRVDIPMGEFWNGLSSTLQGNLPIRRTPKLAASIAHINGKKIVAAEAFTSEPESSGWQEYPFVLKALGDKMFARGINRLVMHRFAHQPHPSAVPGMTMGPWGMHFDRTNTWWEKSKDWITYLSRCQSLLQAGNFVADLLYFKGEEGGNYTRVNREELIPMPPEGYDYDLVNAEVLLKYAKLKEGKIKLSGGITYSVLILQDFKALTYELLLKLKELVLSGMVLIGAPPVQSLGLSYYSDNDQPFKDLITELWGSEQDRPTIRRKVGKGHVVWGIPLTELLSEISVKPDFTFTSRSGDAPIHFIHRQIGQVHIYFICNERRTNENIVGKFRVEGLMPELCDPFTGESAPIPIYEHVKDGIQVPLQLGPYGSAFIIFRKKVPRESVLEISLDEQVLLTTKPFKQRPRKKFKDVVNNFTISLWAKPEMNIMLKESEHMEKVARPYTDYYTLYPAPGQKLYGPNHTTVGLAIGRNGIAVWEHSEGGPLPVLFIPSYLEGWSHIVLQYKDGVPIIFVNGTKIGEGKRSKYSVHPGLGEAFISEGASYYNGDLTEPELYTRTLNQKDIQLLASQKPNSPISADLVMTLHGKQYGFLIWRNGKYTLQKNTGKISSFAVSGIEPGIELNESWQLSFPSGLRAPESILLPQLTSLHLNKDPRIKYFSGTVTYSKDFHFDNDLHDHKRYILDLGAVEVIATVEINGKGFGTLWKRPYQIDITSAIRKGANKLKIEVTNLWINRLIGDERTGEKSEYVPESGEGSFEQIVGGGIQKVPEWYIKRLPKPEDGRVTFTTWKYYTKDSPLVASGLIGPVVLYTTVFVSLKD